MRSKCESTPASIFLSRCRIAKSAQLLPQKQQSSQPQLSLLPPPPPSSNSTSEKTVIV